MKRYILAGAAAVAAQTVASASVVYVNPTNIVLTSPNAPAALVSNLDLDSNGTNDMKVTLTRTDWGSAPYYPSASITALNVTSFVGNPTPSNLSNGSVVNSSTFNKKSSGGGNLNAWLKGNSKTPDGNWAIDGTPGFVGIQFGDSGLNMHYGWVRIGSQMASASSTATVTIYDWAYESTANTGITINAPASLADAPAVPEPSSWALFALGATGLAAVRRRRSA